MSHYLFHPTIARIASLLHQSIHTTSYIGLCSYNKLHRHMFTPQATSAYVHTSSYISLCSHHKLHRHMFIHQATSAYVHTTSYVHRLMFIHQATSAYVASSERVQVYCSSATTPSKGMFSFTCAASMLRQSAAVFKKRESKFQEGKYRSLCNGFKPG